MRPRLLHALLLLCALVLATAAPASAAECDRYADPAGSDRADGTLERPFRTPQHLADTLGRGETGCLRAGTYDRTHHGYVARFGRPGVSLRSAPGERARLVGIVMVAHGADDVRLSGLDFVGTGRQSTVKVYAADVVVEDSDITNRQRGQSCMMLGSSSGGRAVRPIVRDNVFHDCGSPRHGNKDHGIYVGKARDGEIIRNVLTNSAAYAIQLYPEARRFRVAGNVIDGGPDTVRGGIVIGGDERNASRGNVVERNVISHTATAGVVAYWPRRVGRGNVVRDNCLWDTDHDDGSSRGLALRGNVVGEPRFRDRSRRDYRLEAGSACLGVVGSSLLR